MSAILHFLFLPHDSNNQKAKTLHLSSLIILFLFIAIFQAGLTLFARINPGVLGFAANIDPGKLIDLTNQQRSAQGLASLQINTSLIEAARQKASLMFTFGCWSHNCHDKTPWSFINNAGYDYLYAGENLAKDFGESESVVNAWMDSPTHRENILNGKYKEVGIAVVNGILNGEETTLVVQMFGAPAKGPSIASAATEKPKAEEMAVVQKTQETAPIKLGKQAPKIMIAQAQKEIKKPLISGFDLTRWFYLGLISILMIILALDSFIITHRQIVRISGKSFVHLSFFMIILISILLTSKGLIL